MDLFKVLERRVDKIQNGGCLDPYSTYLLNLALI